MGGRRYNAEPKLNKKKVFSVVLGLVVIVMFFITLSKLLQESDTLTSKSREEANKYFAVYTEEKWGVINQKGDFIIKPNYDEMIIVPDKNKALFAYTYDVNYNDGTYKTKIINEKNEAQFTEYEQVEFVTNHDSANVLWYENNVIKVKSNGKYGLINFEGRELLKCEYDKIEPLLGVKNTFLITKDNKVGVSDNFGNIIVEAKYKEVKRIEADNKKEFIIIDENDKCGVALPDKTIALECKYSSIKPLTENNVYVVKEEEKWKIVNGNNSINIDFDFDDVIDMSTEYYIIKKESKCGVINKKGETILETEYNDILFSYGDNFIVQKDKKYGVINSNKEEKLKIEYESIVYRKDAEIFEITKEEEIHIYDKNFEDKLIGIISIVNADKGYLRIRVNGEYKYYNFKFEEKQNTEIFTNNTIFLTKKDGKYGYINKKGEIVVECIYNDATEQNEYGYSAINKNGKWGVINSEGKIIIEPKYELDNNTVIDFIGKWHLAEDINANYYTDK